MDPDATYTLFEDAVAQGLRDDIATHAEALRDWLAGGGFVPRDMAARGFTPHTAHEYFRDIAHICRTAN